MGMELMGWIHAYLPHLLVGLPHRMYVLYIAELHIHVLIVRLTLKALPRYFVPKGSHVGSSIIHPQRWLLTNSLHCLGYLKK